MTEKDYNPEQRHKKSMEKQTQTSKNLPKLVRHEARKDKESDEISKEIVKDIEKSGVPKEVAKKEEKLDEEKQEEKKEEKTKTKPKEKKTEAIINEKSIPISTKKATAVCKFIKGKKVENAISDLQEVLIKKKAVPMKGEIPHRKGMMSGRFPKKTAEHFIKSLKRLSANSNVNGLENPIIVTAVANMGQRPFGRFGRVKRKRTHLMIIAKEKRSKEAKR